ncbi:MAG TPA: hypothetical protein VNY35_11245 [Solirubrobacteraceae bacterium]|jgi:hypothetical protein|nr:hypothetical protein [Solirubrobacteraceae bacterium]
MYLKRKLAAGVAAMSIGALGGGLAATPASAIGPGSFVIPAGGTAVFSSASFAACNALSWGYKLNLGADVVVASRPGPNNCGAGAFSPSTATIGPVASKTSLRALLKDNNCGATYYSDGTSTPTPSVDHATVIPTPAKPGEWDIAIADSGGATNPVPCPVKTLPAQGPNFTVHLKITLHPTSTSVSCSPQPVVAGQSTTCTATVTDTATTGPTAPTGTVSFKTSGPGSFSPEAKCKLESPSGASNSCSVTYTPTSTSSTKPVRSDTITAEYGGDQEHQPSQGTTTVTVISPTALAHGSFTIGDETAAIGHAVTFSNTEVEWWGSNWWKENQLSGGPAPSAFKGFAETASSPAECNKEWTTNTGNSSGPPPTVPEYMEVIGASKITQSGSTITGNAPKLAVVKTSPGYLPDPGHKGTGIVVAVVNCP